MPLTAFESLDSIWFAIAGQIADSLWLDNWDESLWKHDGGHNRNVDRFLDRFVFTDNKPLLLCLDEVDRVFNTDIRHEFFASVRAFYNRGAMDATWKKVRWLLSTSSEPSFFIEDLSQSPFNIGSCVRLDCFNADEIELLAQKHGLDLNDALVEKVLSYVGGRPYLSHCLFYHWVKNPYGIDELFNAETAGGGVFKDHLHRYLLHFQQNDILANAMREIIAGRGCKDIKLADRFEAAGLVKYDAHNKVVPLCDLYRVFFGHYLNL